MATPWHPLYLKSKEKLWNLTCKYSRTHLSLLGESPYLTWSGENKCESESFPTHVSLSEEQNMLTLKKTRWGERDRKHSNKLKHAIKWDSAAISVFACSRARCVPKLCSLRRFGSRKIKDFLEDFGAVHTENVKRLRYFSSNLID